MFGNKGVMRIQIALKLNFKKIKVKINLERLFESIFAAFGVIMF